VLGSYLIRREGSRAWAALTTAIRTGRMPARELADGALILIGGTLLLTPGFLTDVVGMFFVLPLTRPLARRALTRVVARRLLGPVTMQRPSYGARTDDGPGPNVVRGDVVD
jgi:UPF0716 protein FxsA